MNNIKDTSLTQVQNSGNKVIKLPHSCDEWEIGGKKEALQLIEDLQEAIKMF